MIPELYFLMNLIWMSWGSGRSRPQQRRSQPQSRKKGGQNLKLSKKAIGVLLLICLGLMGVLVGFIAYLNAGVCQHTGTPIWGWSC